MEVQPERSKHARPGAFHRPDARGMGTEHEVSQLIAAHARWLKPALVVETGTFRADTAAPILQTLNDNASEGFASEFRTYEIDPAAYEASVTRLGAIGPAQGVALLAVPRTLQEDLNAYRGRRVDLAFVDSAYAARAADVNALAPLMAPRGLLFVHDTSMNQLLAQVAAWRRSWNVIEYPTPRGLAVLQRRS